MFPSPDAASDFFNDTFESNSTADLEFNVSQLRYCEENRTEEEKEFDDFSIVFHFIAYSVLLNIIGIFGIVGNIISMIILSRPQMKSSINYLLIGLARCDTVLIITSILLFGLPSIHSTTGHLYVYGTRIHPIIAPVVFPIAMISQTVSVYLTMVVTLERFVAVCHPLQARSLCTCGRARLYVGLVVLFSVLYNITRFWEVGVEECMHNALRKPILRVRPSTLRNSQLYIKVYIHWMYLVFMYIIPFTSLTWLNSRIYAQVRKANQERQRLSRLQKKEIGLATMLLCVVVVFLICNLVALVSNFLEAFWNDTNDFLVETGNLMVTVNSSVNFVIYVIFGEKFKRLFFKLFFPHGLRICGNAFGGRDSPEQTHEDSFMSCNGERTYSIRQHLHRINTTYTKSNKNNSYHPSRKAQSARIQRASSPGPCVYYPARESRGSWEHTSTTNF